MAPPAAMTRLPVLLVPGWSDGARVMGRLRDRFLSAGWPANAVAVVEFRDRFGSNIAHATEIERAAGRLLACAAAESFDVVAHSMGGLAVRRHMGEAGCRVRRVVFLGTPHAGTWVALAAWGGGRREMLPGSDFLRRLPPPPQGIACTTIRTPLDLRVFPGSSARLGGAHDIVIRLATHQGLLRNRAVFESIRRALLADAERVADITVAS